MKTVLLSNSQNTKECIIQLLGREFPLTGKSIHARLAREHSKEISYQGAHKILQEMEQEGIVDKAGKEYCLSRSWVSDVEKFSANLAEAYLNQERKVAEELQMFEHANMTFDSPIRLAEFLIPYLHNQKLNPDKKPGIILARRSYPLIGLSEKDMKILLDACINTPYYALVKGNTILDRLFGQILGKVGFKMKLGVDSIDSFDTLINGDYFAEVHWPPVLMNGWLSSANNVKKINQFDLKAWFDFMHNNCGKINVVTYRNPGLADQIRKQALEHFKGVK
ncbi:MAG: hypothetical protein V1676_02585 [Candidatus Diapherotrites archaeon]